MRTIDRQSVKSLADVVAVILLIATCTALLAQLLVPAPPPISTESIAEPPLPAVPVSLDGTWTKGSESSPVVMMVFGDFECSACGHFANEVLPTVTRNYVDVGTVRLAFWHYPLPQHSYGWSASEAAECAGRQGKFWPMHDILFVKQSRGTRVVLRKQALAIGLELDRFEECAMSKGPEAVERAVSAATVFQIIGTPTVFAGRVLSNGLVQVQHRWSGTRPVAEFASALDHLLADRSWDH